MRPITFALFLFSFLFVSCNGENDEVSSSPNDSVVQQLGEVMSAIDDSGGDDGGYAMVKSGVKNVASIEPSVPFLEKLMSEILPKAQATPCSVATTFSSCIGNIVTRDFQECTIGSYALDGTVTYTFDDFAIDATCAVAANGHSIARDPDFSITGPRGGSYTVSKTNTVGQEITRTSAGIFTFSNDGLRRVLAFRGTTLADWTSTTTSDITITGTTRNGRVANGGVLQVDNNLTSLSCDLTPNTVTWNNTCNCAVSGTWSGTCSDSSVISYEITSCGEGSLTIDGESENITLTQCSSN